MFVLFVIKNKLSRGLVTNYGEEGGGAIKREGGGGHMNFFPLRKGVGGGGGAKSFSHAGLTSFLMMLPTPGSSFWSSSKSHIILSPSCAPSVCTALVWWK